MLEESTAGSKVDFFVKGVLATLAMLDYPTATDFITPLPANPVKVACEKMDGTLHSLRSLLDLFFNSTGGVLVAETP